MKLTRAIDYGVASEAIFQVVVYAGCLALGVYSVARLIWGG